MKSTFIKALAAATVALGGGVHAQEATSDAWMREALQGAQGRSFYPKVTRDEVRKEFFRARAAGELPPVGEADTRIAQGDFGAGAQGRSFLASTRTRDEVRKEFFRARAAGELPPIGEADALP
jgi:hypothetical protein